VAGLLAAIGWEFLDRRVRSAADMAITPGVPMIGVLREEGKVPPLLRRLMLASPDSTPPSPRGLLAGPRSSS
jgi:hypothetical protein